MKLEEIKTILEDTSLTLNQKAANLEAAILKATAPSALNIKAKVERKKREVKVSKTPALSVTIGNGEDHAEAH